jgi:hypothetical protein
VGEQCRGRHTGNGKSRAPFTCVPALARRLVGTMTESVLVRERVAKP